MNIAALEAELTELLNNNPELFELQATLSMALSHIEDPMKRVEYIMTELVTNLRTMTLILQLTNMEINHVCI